MLILCDLQHFQHKLNAHLLLELHLHVCKHGAFAETRIQHKRTKVKNPKPCSSHISKTLIKGKFGSQTKLFVVVPDTVIFKAPKCILFLSMGLSLKSYNAPCTDIFLKV